MRTVKSNTTLNGREIIETIRNKALRLKDKDDLEPLLERIGDASIVMLGEASHGTHEYYTWRSYISKRLITEKGFNFIAVEGDWPDCYEVNRYVKNYPDTKEKIVDVLHTFDRWPTWMWANWEVAALAEWLKKHNQKIPDNKKVGFYGLDVYSLWESMEEIMKYLEKVDPAALEVAREAYRCFEPHKKDEGQSYARALQFVPETCEAEVVELLIQIQKRIKFYESDYENVFSVEQNALITVNAERYYRSMLDGGPHSWNIRDTHMAETLERLLGLHGPGAKAIVWEHNTHIGDARATDMAKEGMFNIGEIARIHHHKNVVLVGFGSYEGTVIAGRSWGARMQKMEVPPAQAGSWEFFLHGTGPKNKLLIMDDLNDPLLSENYLGHRAIGVVYNPEYEKFGNYVPSILPLRYDAFIYLDKTKALHPLHIEPDKLLVPETYPFGV